MKTFKTFKECVDDYEKNGKEEIIRNKLKDFRLYFEKLRLLSEFTGAGEILARAIAEKGLDLEISAMPLGSLRLARMESFISSATKNGKSLSVIDFLETIRLCPDSLSMPVVAGENTVREMTVHASKGLEFPIVILASTDSPFNMKDLSSEIILGRKEGIAVRCYDEKTMTQSLPISFYYAQKAERRELVKEQARLFYVGMTRAQARLHVISSKAVREDVDDFAVLNASSFTDFYCKKNFIYKTHLREELTSQTISKPQQVLIGKGRESLSEKIGSYLAFDYPFSQAIDLPVKQAVTKIAEEFKTTENFKPFVADGSIPSKKAVLTEEGTLYHKFMQFALFDGTSSKEQAKKMLSDNIIDEKQLNSLDLDKLDAVLSSPVLKSLRGWDLYREQPFIAYFPANEIKKSSSSDPILTQGIIDLLAVKDGEAVIIDYKASSASPETLAERYKTQLAIYSLAVEKVLKLKVVKRYLLNLLTTEYTEA